MKKALLECLAIMATSIFLVLPASALEIPLEEVADACWGAYDSDAQILECIVNICTHYGCT